MYHKRLEYLQQKFPENKSASAMLAESYKGAMTGTPCFITTGEFYPYVLKRDMGKKVFVLDGIPQEELKEVGLPTGRNVRELRTELGPLRKLQDKGLIKIGDMQEVIRTSGITVHASTMLAPSGINMGGRRLPNLKESLSFTTFGLHGSNVIYRGKTPLMYDSIQEVSAEDIRNIYSEGELENFPEIVSGVLETDVRSMNITITDNKASRLGSIQDSLRDMINRLSNAYPHNVCMLCPDGAIGIMDLVSISFYDLDDFIPVFDVKKGRGIAVEVLFTNSQFKVNQVVQSSILYVFAFAKQRENLFVIDGEPLERPLDVVTPVALESMLATLAASVPNDVKKPKKKTTDRRKQVCAE